jgi:hypothetical protein
MQHILLWKGREYESLEHCNVFKADDIRIASTIIGYYNGKSYHVIYDIVTDDSWTTRQVDIHFQINDQYGTIHLERMEKHWLLHGEHASQFDHCIDVDIPLTPFTNSLPINRLQLEKGDEARINVIYLDLLAGEITPVEQLYRRIAEDTYHYENVPNDFQADIKVDQYGFVLEYPLLFSRVDLR